MQVASFDFGAFPNEIIPNIFAHLDLYTLLKVMPCVSKRIFRKCFNWYDTVLPENTDKGTNHSDPESKLKIATISGPFSLRRNVRNLSSKISVPEGILIDLLTYTSSPEFTLEQIHSIIIHPNPLSKKPSPSGTFPSFLKSMNMYPSILSQNYGDQAEINKKETTIQHSASSLVDSPYQFLIPYIDKFATSTSIPDPSVVVLDAMMFLNSLSKSGLKHLRSLMLLEMQFNSYFIKIINLFEPDSLFIRDCIFEAMELRYSTDFTTKSPQIIEPNVKELYITVGNWQDVRFSLPPKAEKLIVFCPKMTVADKDHNQILLLYTCFNTFGCTLLKEV